MAPPQTRPGRIRRAGETVEQPASASALPASIGVLLRARRHRACLSQEQLAARAELSERTVRNLEAGRVQSPRTDTVRLLADALQLSEPERESWLEAARGGQPGTAVHEWAGRAGRDARARHGGPPSGPDGRELAELRRETRRLREAVENLQRAAAIFAAATPRPLRSGPGNQPDAGQREHDAHPRRLRTAHRRSGCRAGAARSVSCVVLDFGSPGPELRWLSRGLKWREPPGRLPWRAARQAVEEELVSHLAAIVIHCRQPAALADFYAEVLGLPVAPADAAAIKAGTLGPDESVLLGSRDACTCGSPRVRELEPIPGRVRLDVRLDAATQLDRLIALGAARQWADPSDRWTVLADPEGNLFCAMYPAS
jgi:transcriptional regulator with XRE-family HTH domain